MMNQVQYAYSPVLLPDGSIVGPLDRRKEKIRAFSFGWRVAAPSSPLGEGSFSAESYQSNLPLLRRFP
jgi:hypothetical protein